MFKLHKVPLIEMDIIKKEAQTLFVPFFIISCRWAWILNQCNWWLNPTWTADTRVVDMDTEISSYCTADTTLTTNNYRDVATVCGDYAGWCWEITQDTCASVLVWQSVAGFKQVVVRLGFLPWSWWRLQSFIHGRRFACTLHHLPQKSGGEKKQHNSVF